MRGSAQAFVLAPATAGPTAHCFRTDGDLGPAGWDLWVPCGLATSKCTWRTVGLAGWVSVPRWPSGGPLAPAVFSESGTLRFGHLGCQRA